MPSQSAASFDPTADRAPIPPRREREDAASILLEYDEARGHGWSQRAAAKDAGVPRSTVRHWINRRRDLDLPVPVAAFLETPAGLAWLHRLVMAAAFVMTLRGPEGIRLVCEFLELSGLAEVVASSFGSIQKLTLRMQEQVADSQMAPPRPPGRSRHSSATDSRSSTKSLNVLGSHKSVWRGSTRPAG